MNRYERQIIMEELGPQGQALLKKASVTVIGCGGLGSPTLTYLAAAGVGRIRIIDGDFVSENNLNRQFLHWQSDIGKEKTVSAKEKLEQFNPEIEIIHHTSYVNKDNAEDLFTDTDVVVDCVDNIETRLLVNKMCLKQDVSLVEGAVSGFFGYVLPVSRKTACLECIGFKQYRNEGNVPAFGAVAGVVGSLQAMEAVKIILGRDDVLWGKILSYNAGKGSLDTVEVKKSESCKIHKLYTT